MISFWLHSHSPRNKKDEPKKKGYKEFHSYSNGFVKPSPYSKPPERAFVNGVAGPKAPSIDHYRRPAIQRSQSDVHHDRRSKYNKDRKRGRDAKNEGRKLEVKRDSVGSDMSAPTGIWTSNPTLTQGIQPSSYLVNHNPGQKPSQNRLTRHGSMPLTTRMYSTFLCQVTLTTTLNHITIRCC